MRVYVRARVYVVVHIAKGVLAPRTYILTCVGISRNTQNSEVTPPARKSASKGTSSPGGGRQPQSSYLAQRGAELNK